MSQYPGQPNNPNQPQGYKYPVFKSNNQPPINGIPPKQPISKWVWWVFGGVFVIAIIGGAITRLSPSTVVQATPTAVAVAIAPTNTMVPPTTLKPEKSTKTPKPSPTDRPTMTPKPTNTIAPTVPPSPTTDQNTANTAGAIATQTAIAAPTPVFLPYSGNVSQLVTALENGQCVDAGLFKDNDVLKIHDFTKIQGYWEFLPEVKALNGKTVCIVGTVDGPPDWGRLSGNRAGFFLKESNIGLNCDFIDRAKFGEANLKALDGKRVKLHGTITIRIAATVSFDVLDPSGLEILA